MTVWMLTMGELHEGATHIELFNTYDGARVEAEKWIEQSSFENWEWVSDFAACCECDQIQIGEMFVR